MFTVYGFDYGEATELGSFASLPRAQAYARETVAYGWINAYVKRAGRVVFDVLDEQDEQDDF